MSDDYRLSVLICAVDETESLEKCVAQLRDAVDAYEYVFVLSRDCLPETRRTVLRLCEAPDCRYLVQDSYGYGNAIRNGIAATAGTHMLMWTADGGLDVSSVPEMKRISESDPKNIVKVSRWLPGGGFVNYGRLRKIANYLSQKAFAVLYGVKLTDFTNGALIAPLDLFKNIRWDNKDFSFVPEMIFKPLRLGVRFTEVPCVNYERREGVSHVSFAHLVKYYLVIFRIRFEDRSKLILNSGK
ncbi:MAG: glycosyltransferase [Clostridia bacterium]|nr:glycosyltransferase [Clostridia bacterium]